MTILEHAYKFNDLVEVSSFGLAFSKDLNDTMNGRIVGLLSAFPAVNYYFVELDDFPPNWPYKGISVVSTLMRPKGSKEDFGFQKL